MQDHYADPGIYIRSMATRGSLGGLARATADATTVLDASGRDLVMIETVGVGQDEVDIVRLADVTIVILVPGMGDDVQSIKAGIMEIADIFVINKSDREGAERVEREIRALQSLATRNDRWTPPIVKTVASEGKGTAELADAIANYEAYLKKENLVFKKNVENWQERLVEMLRDAMLEKARKQLDGPTLERYAAEIAEHKRDPYSLVEEIVGREWQETDVRSRISNCSSCNLAAMTSKLRSKVMFTIDHLGIAVKSLTAAKSIYEKLGLTVSPKKPSSRKKSAWSWFRWAKAGSSCSKPLPTIQRSPSSSTSAGRACIMSA